MLDYCYGAFLDDANIIFFSPLTQVACQVEEGKFKWQKQGGSLNRCSSCENRSSDMRKCNTAALILQTVKLLFICCYCYYHY